MSCSKNADWSQARVVACDFAEFKKNTDMLGECKLF